MLTYPRVPHAANLKRIRVSNIHLVRDDELVKLHDGDTGIWCPGIVAGVVQAVDKEAQTGGVIFWLGRVCPGLREAQQLNADQPLHVDPCYLSGLPDGEIPRFIGEMDNRRRRAASNGISQRRERGRRVHGGGGRRGLLWG